MRNRAVLFALLGLPSLSVAAPTTVDDLRLGPRWHGFRIEPGAFARKVVLAVWLPGGEIDGKLLQDIAALARDAAEKPFHVLVFSGDGSRRGELCGALVELGVAYGAPNLTAMGPAPGAAQGDEPAPSAMLFARHGGCTEEGPLGPDGAFLAATRRALDATPVIDIGQEARVSDLAPKVAAKLGFPATMVAVQKGMKDAKGRDERLYDELFVLDAVVNGYYHERVELGKRLAALQPSLTLPFFEALDRDFRDTTQGKVIETWVQHYRDSKAHAAAVTLERGYLGARKALEAERCCAACRGQGFRLFRYDCATCIVAQKGRIEATIARLRKLLKAKFDEKQMPFLQEVGRYVDELSRLSS